MVMLNFQDIRQLDEDRLRRQAEAAGETATSVNPTTPVVAAASGAGAMGKRERHDSMREQGLAQNVQTTGGGITASGFQGPSGVQRSEPAPQPDQPQQPSAPSAQPGTQPITDLEMANGVNQDDIDTATLMRGLQLIQSGSTTSPEDLERVRQQSNLAGAQEGRNLRAQFAASGFNTSGLAAQSLSDQAVQNALATERAVADEAQRGRQEQLERLLAGANLAQSGRVSRQRQEQFDLLMQMLADVNGGGEPPATRPGVHNPGDQRSGAGAAGTGAHLYGEGEIYDPETGDQYITGGPGASGVGQYVTDPANAVTDQSDLQPTYIPQGDPRYVDGIPVAGNDLSAAPEYPSQPPATFGDPVFQDETHFYYRAPDGSYVKYPRQDNRTTANTAPLPIA